MRINCSALSVLVLAHTRGRGTRRGQSGWCGIFRSVGDGSGGRGILGGRLDLGRLDLCRSMCLCVIS